jgi:signal transduction histidine kinase/DNA-binding CsgD family transcriptional regulator
VNELLQTCIHVRDQERQRLIQLLEERLAGSLNLILAQSTAFRSAYVRSAAQAHAFDTLIGMAARAQGDFRDLVADLDLGVVDDLGLGGALEVLAVRIERFYGLSVALDLPAEALARASYLAPVVYRIAQEALHNAGQHAGAGQVGFNLRVRHDQAWLIVADDGDGFVPPEPLDALAAEGKWGLAEMAERAAAVGGTLDVSSVSGIGTQVRAQLPLELPAGHHEPGSGQNMLDDVLVESLTSREQDVLAGVAAGQTNKQIAARLGISDRTVQFHLGNVLGKLGVSSRTEAAVLALQRGLV